jgi:hypothetical protein
MMMMMMMMMIKVNTEISQLLLLHEDRIVYLSSLMFLSYRLLLFVIRCVLQISCHLAGNVSTV